MPKPPRAARAGPLFNNAGKVIGINFAHGARIRRIKFRDSRSLRSVTPETLRPWLLQVGSVAGVLSRFRKLARFRGREIKE